MQINSFKIFPTTLWVRRTVWLLAGVLLLWGLAWAVLPGVVKSQLEQMASERLGRAVQVGSISVRPWTLELTLTDLSVAGPGGQGRQLQIKRIYLDAELQSLLKRAPVVDAFVVEGVSATLTHLGEGRYDVDDILARLAAAATPEETPRPLPRFALHNLRLEGLSLDFVDQPAGKTHTVRDLTFSLPFLSNLDALREVSTEPRLAFELNGAHFDSAAQSTPFAVSHKTQAQFHLTGLDARSFLPYLPRNLPLQLQSGSLDVDIQVAFEQTDKPQIKISGAVQAQGVRIADAQARQVLAFDALRVEIAELRPLEQMLALAAVELRGPALDLRRDKSGHVNLLMRQDPAAQPSRAHIAPASDQPWRVEVAKLALRSGQVRWTDQATAAAVLLEARDVTLDAAGFAWPKASPMQASGAFTLRPQAGAARDAVGQVSFSGVVALQPLSVQGKLQATRLPLPALAPYLADVLNVDLLRAQAGFNGDLSYVASDQGPAVQLRGDAALDGLQANSVVAAGASAAELPLGQELLSWKSLSVRGLALSLTPGQPTVVDVGQAALTDFYARVIVNENGRINLQDLVKSASPAPSASGPPPPASASKPPLIRVGQTSLINGRVLFSDRFIQPNYTARLTELTGRLGAFSSAPSGGASDAAQMADLELRGRAEGSASLEITGKLNPLAQPLALDIQGRVRNLELPPLSSYSVKYAGHGIERGQLSMDVAYRVEPDGQLTASNKLVLNQLTFGDAVQGAPNSLPVRLAVALLADRHGVIDVELPISGSLKDPEFRLGSIIFKVIVNLVTKAITAPFSLLSSIFSGGDEHSVVSFAPGSAVLDAQAREKLDKVARTLKERPALRMTVTGLADLDAERQAYRQERLRALLQAEKQRAAVLAGKSGAEVAPLNAAEMPALLKEVYRRSAIAKPRNLIGMVKDIAPAEMEALLLTSIAVNETVLRELAAARGAAVKDYLGARELPAAQLFLGNPKLLSSDAKGGARAELELVAK